jgi:hypothetical protein
MARKEYVAVVQGVINIESYPPIEKISFNSSNKKRKNQEIIEKSTPSWQDQALEKGLSLHFAALKNLMPNPSMDFRIQSELRELSNLSYDEFRGNNKLRKRLRKVLKSLGLLDSITSEESSFITSEYLPQPPEAIPIIDKEVEILPCQQTGYTYRLSTEQLCYVNSSAKFKLDDTGLVVSPEVESLVPDTLWINAPIQDIPGDFRMSIPSPDADLSESSARHCETKVKILRYGTYQGKPVTKVSLMPISGRRHQLRLHCLAMGHPIGKI